MAAGMVLTVAQTLFAALECQEVRELCSMLTGYESKLEELQRTVKTIKAVLLDAEFKHREVNNEGRVWFEELKDAVYDADDFFDELTTKAQLKKLSGKKVSKRMLNSIQLLLLEAYDHEICKGLSSVALFRIHRGTVGWFLVKSKGGTQLLELLCIECGSNRNAVLMHLKVAWRGILCEVLQQFFDQSFKPSSGNYNSFSGALCGQDALKIILEVYKKVSCLI